MSDADTTPQWMNRPGGHRLAYHYVPGTTPGIVFLGGYASDMTGTKATWLDAWCRARGRAYVRFDYLGHGQSTGAFAEGTLSRWIDDALAVLDGVTDGPQVLIGSSMGGWIMLHLALARPERVAGLVGIAAAPDFSQDIWWSLTPDQRAELEAEGTLTVTEEGGAGYTVSMAFIEDGRANLVMRRPLELACPVRLLQGMRDTSVAWPTAQRIARTMTGDDCVVTLVKDGDHRLSREQDLARLGATLDELLGT